LDQPRRIKIAVDDASVISAIVQKLKALEPDRALLVGVSGIDGSGKSFIAFQLADQLRELGHNVAAISADDWLNLPSVCINRQNPAEHFYEYALRLDEMFGQLVLPLKQRRHVDLVAACGDAKATVHRKHRYLFHNVDIVLLEGIFLFKPTYRNHFDFKVWIECSFPTGLRRAIIRGPEGLSPVETEKAFQTIYFPAQQIYLKRDDPRGSSDFVLQNEMDHA
jgi:uridine kinase